MGIWEDFIDIFYAPSAVFSRRENGNVFIPLAVVTIACGVLFYLNSGALQPMFDAEFDRSMAIAMRQNPNIPPEAVERIRTFAVRMQQVGTFIFIPLAIVGVGVTTWLAGKLVDAKQTFRAAMIVAAYAYAPRILDSVLLGLQGLFLDPAQLDGRFRLSFGVGPLSRSRYGFTAAPRDRRPRGCHHDLDHGAHRHRTVRDGPHSVAESGDRRRHRVVRGWAADDYRPRFARCRGTVSSCVTHP